MANRLSTIATRTGDDGTTGLGDGSRTRKDDARIQVIGEIDELNATLGVLLVEPLPDPVRADLLFVLARVLNRAAGVDDVLWQRERGGQ